MGPIRKLTIDRRRRPKGSVPPKPDSAAPFKDREDSSVDIPTPKKAAGPTANTSKTDSSADAMTPSRKNEAPPPPDDEPAYDDSRDEQKSDSDEDEAHDVKVPSKEEEEEPAPAKKKTVRSKATPKRKTLKSAQAKRCKKKKAPPSDDESEEVSEASGGESNVSEFDLDDEDEESDVSEESHEKSKRGRAKKPSAGRRRISRNAKESDDDSEASWNSEDESERQTTRKARAPKRSTRAARSNGRGKKESDSEESWKSDMENERQSSTYRTPRGTRRNSRVPRLHSSDEEEDYSPRRSTPSRRSATKALKRIHHDVEKDENAEEEEDEEVVPSTRKRRKNKKSDEDDDYDPDMEEVEDDNDEDLSDEGSSDAFDEDDKQYKAGNVDVQQDFLTADSSDDENAAGPSPMLGVKHRPSARSRSRGRPAIQKSDSFASNDSDGDVMQEGPTLSFSPHMPDCPSETDAITMDPLPEKHLCYFPPDQQTRQCFALETLHKIAFTSSIRGHDGKPIFLQPPHFRTPASDDFIDQIASRFGRAALDLTGDFNNRGKLHHDGYMLTIGANLADEDTFQERLNDYISNLMGSQDVCCCPLCYIESHRRLANRLSGEEGDSSDEDDPEEPAQDENEPIELWHDPMTVLGFPDNDKYTLASTFCFSKMSDVKRHLREDHNIDTKVLDSNDLFARFKVRAGDGLLQRYIEKTKRRLTYQGDMRRYWNMGNNQTFVFLIYLMKRRADFKKMIAEGSDATGDASALFDDAQTFFCSFENRAKRTWESVSAPYRKATREEIDEFIEGGDVEEDDQLHFAMRRELDTANPEDEIIEALRQRRMSQGIEQESEDSSGEEDVDDDGSSEDEVENPDNIPGYYSEEEEEDDDWVTSKLARPGRRNKVSPSSSRNSKSATNGKRLGRAREDKQPDGQLKRDPDSPDSKPPPTKKVKRSRVIIDSDSDE